MKVFRYAFYKIKQPNLLSVQDSSQITSNPDLKVISGSEFERNPLLYTLLLPYTTEFEPDDDNDTAYCFEAEHICTCTNDRLLDKMMDDILGRFKKDGFWYVLEPMEVLQLFVHAVDQLGECKLSDDIAVLYFEDEEF